MLRPQRKARAFLNRTVHQLKRKRLAAFKARDTERFNDLTDSLKLVHRHIELMNQEYGR